MNDTLKISKLLKARDYKGILTQLNLESIESFTFELVKHKCLHDKNFNKLFWEDYFPDHPYFKEIIVSEEAYPFIEAFIRVYRLKQHRILVKISYLNPEVLLIAVRRTKFFLRNDFHNSLKFWGDSENTKLRDHFSAMSLLHLKDRELLTTAKDAIKRSNLSYEDWIIVLTIHYLKSEDPKTRSFKQYQISFIDGYNKLIAFSFLLSTIIEQEGRVYQTIDIKKLNYDEFLKYSEVIELWINWYEITHLAIDNYANDDNIDIEIKQNGLRLYPRDVKLKSLEIEENLKMHMGITKWHSHFMDKTMTAYWYAIMNNDVPLPKMSEIWRTISDMTVLYEISKIDFFFKLYGIERSDHSAPWKIATGIIDIHRVQNCLLLPAFNHSDRSDEKNWFEMTKLILSKGPDFHPVAKIEYNQWIKLFTINESFNNDDSRKLTKQILFDFNDTSKFQTRDGLKIDLIKRPFILHENKVIYPSLLFSSIDLIWSILEVYLDGEEGKSNKAIKKETDNQEKEISKYLHLEPARLLNNLVILDRENPSDKAIGEIDALLWQEDELLLVEIKRSKLRLTPQDRRIEKTELIPKAKKQLEKVINYLRANNDCLEEYGIPRKAIESAKITGLVLTMNTCGDRIRLNNNIYKTSFAALAGLIVPSRSENGNKVRAFINKLEEQYDFLKNIKPDPANFSIEIENPSPNH